MHLVRDVCRYLDLLIVWGEDSTVVHSRDQFTDINEIVAKIASKPRPGSNGRIGFIKSSDENLWMKIRAVTGGNKRYKPVTGKRRTDLEQLGYTVENGFFP